MRIKAALRYMRMPQILDLFTKRTTVLGTPSRTHTSLRQGLSRCDWKQDAAHTQQDPVTPASKQSAAISSRKDQVSKSFALKSVSEGALQVKVHTKEVQGQND